MLTVGITSYNRGKYLDVLLNSIEQECLSHKHQVILVDNFSTEPRVFETINKHKNIITHFIDRRKNKDEKQNWVNDEYVAKNYIINNAKGNIILFLQDDLQFIGYNGAMLEYATFLQFSTGYCLTCNAVRKSTIKSTKSQELYSDETAIAFKYKDSHFHTMGFFKKTIFNQCGPYETNWTLEQKNWGRSEDDYDMKVKKMCENKRNRFVSMQAYVPLFVPVWNDPRGGYAFIRNNKRYGYYAGAVEGEKLLYKQYLREDFQNFILQQKPLSFVDVANPIGWNYKVDSNGDQIKYAQSKIMIEGPIQGIEQ